MLTVNMEAENAWNKLIAFKPSKDSVYKGRRPETILYDSTQADQEMHCLG